jgi:uncharacterized membrane protein YhdT
VMVARWSIDLMKKYLISSWCVKGVARRCGRGMRGVQVWHVPGLSRSSDCFETAETAHNSVHTVLVWVLVVAGRVSDED